MLELLHDIQKCLWQAVMKDVVARVKYWNLIIILHQYSDLMKTIVNFCSALSHLN